METKRKKIIAVIGNSKISKCEYKLAYNVGKELVDKGYAIQCGGLGGVMEAVCKGARDSSKYVFGDTIAITPSYDRTIVNEFVDIVIPTGMDLQRNCIVANADAVVAIGGGAGTLSEMAYAWTLFKLIIAFYNVEGWSKELSGKRIDNRVRYPNIPEDSVYGVASPSQMTMYLEKYMHLYVRQFKGITYYK